MSPTEFSEQIPAMIVFGKSDRWWLPYQIGFWRYLILNQWGHDSPLQGKILSQAISSQKIHTKRGIKVWMRADAMNGYVSQFLVYFCKVGGWLETQLREWVVKDLTRNLVGKHYIVYCDNFFTSVQLFNDLLKDSIYACGTIRWNRVGYSNEYKPFLKKGPPERGDYKTIEKENSIVARKQNSKCSIYQLQKWTSTVTRKQKDGTRKTFTCPLNWLQQAYGGLITVTRYDTTTVYDWKATNSTNTSFGFYSNSYWQMPTSFTDMCHQQGMGTINTLTSGQS